MDTGSALEKCGLLERTQTHSDGWRATQRAALTTYPASGPAGGGPSTTGIFSSALRMKQPWPRPVGPCSGLELTSPGGQKTLGEPGQARLRLCRALQLDPQLGAPLP